MIKKGGVRERYQNRPQPIKKQFSILLLIFCVSANINAEISGVSIRDLKQLYNHQIIKILLGNKLFGH